MRLVHGQINTIDKYRVFESNLASQFRLRYLCFTLILAAKINYNQRICCYRHLLQLLQLLSAGVALSSDLFFVHRILPAVMGFCFFSQNLACSNGRFSGQMETGQEQGPGGGDLLAAGR